MSKKKSVSRAALIKAFSASLAKKHKAAKPRKAKATRARRAKASKKALGGLFLGERGYGLSRGRMRKSTGEGNRKACFPTVPQTAKSREHYNTLCKSYTRLGNEYHALGNSVMGAPKGSPLRKQYHTVQKQYKEIGVQLFKLGRPKSDYGDQHKMSRSEWSKDYDAKRRKLTASYGKAPAATYRR